MKELDQIYRKHKKQLLPIIFGFAAVFILFRVILPQWSDIQDVQDLISTKNDTVKAKDDTVTLLNSISDETVNDDYTLATTALPLQKDIVLIFSELTDASQKAGVQLGGFTVKVGSIYSSSKKTTTTSQKTINGIPYLNILVNVKGKSDGLRQFTQEMYMSMPVVEVRAIDIAKTDGRYDVNFYFKPVSLKAPNADTTALTNLNPIETAQLKELKSWQANPIPPSQ